MMKQKMIERGMKWNRIEGQRGDLSRREANRETFSSRTRRGSGEQKRKKWKNIGKEDTEGEEKNKMERMK